MSSFLTGGGRVSVTLTATQKVAVYSQGLVNVYRTSGFANYPDNTTLIGTVINGQTVFGTPTPAAPPSSSTRAAACRLSTKWVRTRS